MMHQLWMKTCLLILIAKLYNKLATSILYIYLHGNETGRFCWLVAKLPANDVMNQIRMIMTNSNP